jgi:hypothetical protein
MLQLLKVEDLHRFLKIEYVICGVWFFVQVVTQGMVDGGSVGLLIVVTGASHLLFGSRGVGLPARISKKLQKKTQIVVLLNPERQRIRMEGNVPEVKQCYDVSISCLFMKILEGFVGKESHNLMMQLLNNLGSTT